jgi:hypothetical protein
MAREVIQAMLVRQLPPGMRMTFPAWRRSLRMDFIIADDGPVDLAKLQESVPFLNDRLHCVFKSLRAAEVARGASAG